MVGALWGVYCSGHLCLIWSQELVSDDQGAFGNSYKRPLLASKVTLVLGSASMALGQDSTRNRTIWGFAHISHLNRIINSMMLPEYII